jgi:hypothetical protein
MPFDPLSAGLMIGGKVLDLFKEAGAAENARRDQAYQREAIARQMAETSGQRAAAMRLAGGLRQDRFGNATYYDPTQGRWVTYYTPRQQRLIEQGQERQERANIRGAQASQDYDTLRGEYLYRRPKSEAESYAEIVNLLNQATGQGERALNTLTSRWGTRTAGNLPQLVQTDTGPSPGQQLAETMLQARKAALEEYGSREKIHQSRYLPAMEQFEKTANYMAPIDPTGSEITGYQSEGISNMLKYGSDYDKMLATLAMSGNRGGTAGAARGGGGGFGDLFNNLAKMLAPEKAAAGTTGGTRGARASTSGGGGATYKGSQTADAFGDIYGITRGYGGDRPYLTPGSTSRLFGDEPVTGASAGTISSDPYFESYWSGSNPLTLGSRSGAGYGSEYASTLPYYGGVGADYSEGYYRTPWQF